MIIKNVGVIGAGTMGNGIAHVFAQFGYNVLLVDIKDEPCPRAMARGWGQVGLACPRPGTGSRRK